MAAVEALLRMKIQYKSFEFGFGEEGIAPYYIAQYNNKLSGLDLQLIVVECWATHSCMLWPITTPHALRLSEN